MLSRRHFSVLKNGSCAIGNCEPCQVGNQAALSSDSNVPQGCLFGAEVPVNGCSHASILECMILSGVRIFYYRWEAADFAMGRENVQSLVSEMAPFGL